MERRLFSSFIRCFASLHHSVPFSYRPKRAKVAYRLLDESDSDGKRVIALESRVIRRLCVFHTRIYKADDFTPVVKKAKRSTKENRKRDAKVECSRCV